MSQNYQAIPSWLAENALLERLLNAFIDQCDRPSAVRFRQKIKPEKWPELYDLSNNNHQSLWTLIEQTLYRQHNVIEQIQYKRNSTSERLYDQPTLHFNHQKEALVRGWLARPKVESYPHQWRAALELYPHFKATSLAQPIKVRDFNAELIMASFAKSGELIETLHQTEQNISLRGLSARCFWGDSKFLDMRRKLIYDVFPKAKTTVRDRMIMMSVYAPKTLESAIFVENFDSFITLVDALKQSPRKDTTAVIYSAGYRATASLIRQRGQSQFLYINLVSPDAVVEFEDWWYQASDRQTRCYFWGDLDYEGLKILRTLRNNFAQIMAWKEAYQVIVEYHHQGLGHFAHQANKDNQQPPLPSGCDYSDSVLLPLLKQSKRFIDQEIVDKARLIEILN